MLDDPEYAEQVVAAHPERGGQAPPDWLSWTTEAEGLAVVQDMLSQLIKDKDPKHRKVRTARRPVTEVQRAYERAEDAATDAFEDDVYAALGITSVV